MKVFVFKSTNENIGNFKIRTFEELESEFQRFISTRSVSQFDFLECPSRTWTVMNGTNGFELAEGRRYPTTDRSKDEPGNDAGSQIPSTGSQKTPPLSELSRKTDEAVEWIEHPKTNRKQDEPETDAASQISSTGSEKKATIRELGRKLDEAVEWIEQHPSEPEHKMPDALQEALFKFGENVDSTLRRSEVRNWLTELGLSDRVINHAITMLKDSPSCPKCDRLAVEISQSDSGIGKILFWIVGGIVYVICWQGFGWPGFVSALPAAIVGGMCTMIGASVTAKCPSCGNQWKP